MDGDDIAARRRAEELRERAARAVDAAAVLEDVAADAVRRLEPVLARMGPQVWAGEGARRVAAAAEDAREDLAVAAVSLREVARDLRWEAATLSWSADGLVARLTAGAGP